MNALSNINKYFSNDLTVLKEEKWLEFLSLTDETYVNYERIEKLSNIQSNYSLLYVKRSLEILETLNLEPEIKEIIEEVLKWSEVSKTGSKSKRSEWKKHAFNLFIHNIGSAQIYLYETEIAENKDLISTLIATHGLIGQYLRGEVSLYSNISIYELLSTNQIDKPKLESILYHLNHCIIGAVSNDLWNQLETQVLACIHKIMNNDFIETNTLQKRVQLLREKSIKNGEDITSNWNYILNTPELYNAFESVFNTFSLWYVEAALNDFTFLEFCKIILLVNSGTKNKNITNISFEKLMRDLYYDHKGLKRVNIYKKRIIEKYLESIAIEETHNKQTSQDIHVKHIITLDEITNIAFFEFKFSEISSKLIEFCELSENSESIYEKAVIMLFDLFGFRKDKFDRFYNEEDYLKTMNQSIKHKSIILDYIVGNKILDVGPGGGALMNMIEDFNPKLEIIGLDISQNVIENLQKTKLLQHRKWNLIKGDALRMSEYITNNSLDTVIFSSIIHEMFSYIEYEGHKFNKEVIRKVLLSAYQVLKPGGRIIIRDGIMSEPIDQKRIIKFRTSEGMKFLNNYITDFKGRDVKYKLIGHNEVLMTLNDAMEFLYTYTWGEASYVHEVNEQFGYFTPTEYRSFIQSTLGESAEIQVLEHYLQEGYSIALDTKVQFFDENRNPIRYPDSTCFIVVQKQL